MIPQAVGSAERRVWRAGATPFPRRPGSRDRSPSDAAPAPSRLAASSLGPVPMTESARRIAEALDSMTKVSHALCSLGPAPVPGMESAPTGLHVMKSLCSTAVVGHDLRTTWSFVHAAAR